MPKLPKANVDRRKRIPMREQPPAKRVKNFNEVAAGLFTAEEAVNEAKRCLHCDAPDVHRGLPRGRRHPRVRREDRGRKVRRGGEDHQGKE